MAKERKEVFRTDSGIEIPPYILPKEGCGAQERPGEYPFTRGVYPTMYRSKLWTMRMYAGFGTAEESNLRYRYLLSQGVTGLSVAGVCDSAPLAQPISTLSASATVGSLVTIESVRPSADSVATP